MLEKLWKFMGINWCVWAIKGEGEGDTAQTYWITPICRKREMKKKNFKFGSDVGAKLNWNDLMNGSYHIHKI